MRGLWALALAGAALGQTIPLRERVLILVNDRVPESLAVGQYYASKRNIPAGNILRLKMSPAEIISPEEFQRADRNAAQEVSWMPTGGAMRLQDRVHRAPRTGCR